MRAPALAVFFQIANLSDAQAVKSPLSIDLRVAVVAESMAAVIRPVMLMYTSQHNGLKEARACRSSLA
jgi:hypothetical protein